jgi:hypothetical protein
MVAPVSANFFKSTCIALDDLAGAVDLLTCGLRLLGFEYGIEVAGPSAFSTT